MEEISSYGFETALGGFLNFQANSQMSFKQIGRSYRDKDLGRHYRNDHLETAPLGDLSHKQPPNPDTIADANKNLLTGT